MRVHCTGTPGLTNASVAPLSWVLHRCPGATKSTDFAKRSSSSQGSPEQQNQQVVYTHREKERGLLERIGSDFPGDRALKRASQVMLVVKNLPATAGDAGHMGSTPGLGRSPGGGCGSSLSIFAWRIPWTEKACGLYSPRACKQSDTNEAT